MHADLREAIIASVRRRFEQGDCPTEPAHTVEMLEHVILDLARTPLAGGDAIPAGEGEPVAWRWERRGRFGPEIGAWEQVLTPYPPDKWPEDDRRNIVPLYAAPKPHAGGDAIPAGEVHGKWHGMLLTLVNALHRDGGAKTQEIGIDLAYQQALGIVYTPKPPADDPVMRGAAVADRLASRMSAEFVAIAASAPAGDVVEDDKPPAGGDAGAREALERALNASVPVGQIDARVRDTIIANVLGRYDAALALPAPVVEGDADWMHVARESVARALPGSAFADRVMAGRHDDSLEVRAAMRAIDATLAALGRAAVTESATVAEADPETVPGRVIWHTSEEGGGPDVGISVGLGNGSALWVGELLDRDGGPVGIVFHGPKNFRYAAPFADMGEVQYLFEHHVAPAIAALSEGRSHG